MKKKYVRRKKREIKSKSFNTKQKITSVLHLKQNQFLTTNSSIKIWLKLPQMCDYFVTNHGMPCFCKY